MTAHDPIDDQSVMANKTLRIRCGCGRALADVTLPDRNPTWTPDGLMVSARPNVNQEDYRPWDAANRKKWTNPPPPGRVEQIRARVAHRRAGGSPETEPPLPEWDPQWVQAHPELDPMTTDWKSHTYTWKCRCGRNHSRRHERIGGAWVEHITSDAPKITTLIIGQDL